MRVDTVANSEEFNRIINKLDVLSRSRPEDKYALVVGLIERGNVVAVTGDGNYITLNCYYTIFKAECFIGTLFCIFGCENIFRAE